MFREVPALVMAIAPVQPPETDRAYFCDYQVRPLISF